MCRQGLWIGHRCFLKVLLSEPQLLGALLHERQSHVRGCLIWRHFNGRLCFFHSGWQIAELRITARQQELRSDFIGIVFQNVIGMVLRILEASSSKQQVCEIQLSLPILRCQIDSELQFTVAVWPESLLQEATS